MKREYLKCRMTKDEVGAKLIELSKTMNITEYGLRKVKMWSPVKRFWGTISKARLELGISSGPRKYIKHKDASERKCKVTGDEKIRGCLKCHRPFRSKGNWNRICDGCKDINAMFADIAIGFTG